MYNKKQRFTKMWYVSEYVDIDTGEMISKEKRKNEYRIINKIISYENRNGYNIKRTTNECRKSEQTKFQFEENR